MEIATQTAYAKANEWAKPFANEFKGFCKQHNIASMVLIPTMPDGDVTFSIYAPSGSAWNRNRKRVLTWSLPVGNNFHATQVLRDVESVLLHDHKFVERTAA
jgi:hypothetical protein